MVGTPTVYTGVDANIVISGNSYREGHSTFAISDFSLTLSRDTSEQELVGEKGNYFLAGALSCEGSLTACKLHATALGYILSDMIYGNRIQVSGNCGPRSLHFYLHSCQITGFDFSVGPADDIVEGSVDFTMLYPYKLSVNTALTTFTYLQDKW